LYKEPWLYYYDSEYPQIHITLLWGLEWACWQQGWT